MPINVKYVAGLLVVLAISTGSVVLTLIYFWNYQSTVRNLYSADYTVYSKLKLMETRAASLSSSGLSGNGESFSEKLYKDEIEKFRSDFDSIEKRISGSSKVELSKTLQRMTEAKQDADTADLLRSIRGNLFQLYRVCWINKWMTVARSVGQMITEIDSSEFDQKRDAGEVIFPKINQLVSIVTHSSLPQQQKLSIFEQLNALKSIVEKYQVSRQEYQKVMKSRLETFSKIESLSKNLAETSSRGMASFGNEIPPTFVYALLFSSVIFLLSMYFSLSSNKSFSRFLQKDFSRIQKEIDKIHGDTFYKEPDKTLKDSKEESPSFFETDEIIKKVNETVKMLSDKYFCFQSLQRHSSLPTLVVSQTKSALFWNDSMSEFAKQRRFSEIGPVSYSRVLKLFDGKGMAIDPVEMAMSEGAFQSIVCMTRSGSDNIPSLVQCHPVHDGSDRAIAVVVEVRDLRAEQRRMENELEKQIVVIEQAVAALEKNQVLQLEDHAQRKSISRVLTRIKEIVITRLERGEILNGRMNALVAQVREGDEQAKTRKNYIEQLRTELFGFASAIKEMREQTIGMLMIRDTANGQLKKIQEDISSLRSHLELMESDMQRSKSILMQAVELLHKTGSVFHKVKTLHASVENTVRRSSLLDVKNAILQSKPLSGAEIAIATENIREILSQFEYGHRSLYQAVSVLEKAFQGGTSRVQKDIELCLRILSEGEFIARDVEAVESAYGKNTREIQRIFDLAKQVEGFAEHTASTLDSVALRSMSLVEQSETEDSLRSKLKDDIEGMVKLVSGPV